MVLDLLDRVRVSLLRLTLKSTWLRQVYGSKSHRLLFLYCLAIAVYLPLSLFFPLWILVIGPVIWGVPHLFSSFRYVDKAVSKEGRSSFGFIFSIWGIISIFRVFTDLRIIQDPFENPMTPEIMSVVITVAGLIFLNGWKNIASCLWAVPLVALSWLAPLWTVGALLLFHNFVAFAYWGLAAKSHSESRVVGLAFVIFAFVHVLVFGGAFDGIYQYYAPAGSLDWAGLDYAAIGNAIAPWSQNYKIWFHAVVLYAFGQSIHYFVWLKAIPEQTSNWAAPVSFQRSFRLLQTDVGSVTALALVLFSVLSLGIWALTTYPIARGVYFAVASYHGYMELASIGVAISKRQS